jgi:membrane-bound serine protease (ClpP class)
MAGHNLDKYRCRSRYHRRVMPEISIRAARRLLILLILTFSILALACAPDDTPLAVHILTADGEVNGVLERYIERGIKHAEENQSLAVVIRIDTPGGSIDSMKRIVGHIEVAAVPVITWVGPPGAQAASAGTFITMAGHIAAMAPNTTIGAATPINTMGQDIEGDLDKKIENDTVAFARGVAELRNRNADWAEDAVRDAVSSSTSEALELNVVDLEAADIGFLLQAVEGQSVELLSGETVPLQVFGQVQIENEMNLYERVLDIVSSPAIFSLLFFAGLAGLAIEFFAPGNLFPGVAGVIALIASFLGVGTLLPGEAAIAFILVGIVLLILESTVGSGGIFATGGVVALVMGQAIAIGQASTELDLMRILLAVVMIVVTIATFMGIALFIIAKRYMAPTEETGSRVF